MTKIVIIKIRYKNFMAKSKRLVELIMTVNSKKKFTVQELANEFGVSYRTILRDLQELGELGVPLYSEVGANGGYAILKERLLPPISFTESEAISMFFVSQSLKYYHNLPFENESNSALKKFYHYLPSEVKKTIDELSKRLSFWIPTVSLATPFLREVLEASLEQKVIAISYDSETSISKREIQPIGVYTVKGLWYAPAYCFNSKAFRLFRIDRITGFSDKDIKAEKMNLDEVTISDWLINNDLKPEEKETINLVVKLTKKGIKRCDSDMFFSENITLKEDGTGILEITLPSSHISWIVSYFIGCGKDAIVEKPLFIKEMIRENLKELLNYY